MHSKYWFGTIAQTRIARWVPARSAVCKTPFACVSAAYLLPHLLCATQFIPHLLWAHLLCLCLSLCLSVSVSGIERGFVCHVCRLSYWDRSWQPSLMPPCSMHHTGLITTQALEASPHRPQPFPSMPVRHSTCSHCGVWPVLGWKTVTWETKSFCLP